MKIKSFLIGLIVLINFSLSAQDCPVFPHPQNYTVNEGRFYLSDMISVSKQNVSSFVRDDFSRYFTHDLGINTLFINDGGDIVFKKMMNVPTDHYSILVNKKITITYSNEASLFYATQSLKQMIQSEAGEWYIQKCQLTDEPKFQYRGMHLDVSRHFFSVDELKKYIDWMARYKFNRFHWHLTDDQGWRIEIKKYPKLTSIGSIRAQTLIDHASKSPEEFDGIPEKGFYTQKEIKEIVSYAKKRFVEVIPEIEMPGHARAALAAYPEYSCDGVQHPVAEKWGVFEEIFCSKDETIHFLQDVLEEVVELFPGEFIHIGGDEAPKNTWKVCTACQAQMKKHHLNSEAELQSYFIQQMDEFLRSKGKKLIGWDEILEGGLSPNASVMSWRGMAGGIEAANHNHTVVMTPGSHCYFDHYQSDRSTEPLAFGGYTPLDKVYAFNPIPKELVKSKAGLILGAQANVWTEYISDFSHVEYMVLPRMIALSEVLWGTNTDYKKFLTRLKEFEFPYFNKVNATYSNAAFYMQSKIEPHDKGIAVSFFTEGDNSSIVLSDLQNKSCSFLDETTVLLNRTEKPIRTSISASHMEGYLVDNIEVTVLQHSLLGKEIGLKTKPSDFYKGNGVSTLTDGVLGARPWNGKDWLGFQNQTVDLSIDLSEKEIIQTLNLSFLKAEASWIYLPEKVIVQYSKNGKRWKKIELEIVDEQVQMILGKKMKYLKVAVVAMEFIPEGETGAGHLPWTFMDEIWIEK